MRHRHPLPKIWLMTDPRMDNLLTVIKRLPMRSGIVFRHYDLAYRERRALFRRVWAVAHRANHVLILADTPQTAWQWGADGAHSRSRHRSTGLRTMAVHTMREAALARAVKADLIFVSPVFATRSHTNARTIGAIGLGQIAGQQRNRTIALGGMNANRARQLSAMKIYGWAGIDAFCVTAETTLRT
jgi:thiamine-phosphate pyrophosphorylase